MLFACVALLLVAVECANVFNINNMDDFMTFYNSMKEKTFNSDVELNCDLDFADVDVFVPIGVVPSSGSIPNNFNHTFG